MSLSTAVGLLIDSAAPDPAARLAEVQALLARDLGHVESLLAEAAAEGVAPGTDAASHLVLAGGKRVRPLALLLSSACFGPVGEPARQMAAVVELVHSATLLHDDVIDEGDERRGRPTSRRRWGNAVSVLSGDLLLVHALERTRQHAPDALADLLATLRRLVEGEILQLRGRVQVDASENTYERILSDKTASLFGWATRTGARLAGAAPAEQVRLGEFGERLGIAFQLVDDLLDYEGEQTGKSPLADLREGKLTLPLVLACAEEPSLLAELRRVHAGETDSVDHIAMAVRRTGVCRVVRERAIAATDEALAALRGIRATPARRLLEGVASELALRAA